MRNAASKLGWGIFCLALIGTAVRWASDAPADPITAGLKSSGMYRPCLAVLAITLGVLLIYIVYTLRATRALQRRPDRPTYKRKER